MIRRRTAIAAVGVAAVAVIGLMTSLGSAANQSASSKHATAIAHGGSSCSSSQPSGAACWFPQDTSNFPGINPGSGTPASHGIEIDNNVWNAQGCPGYSQTVNANSPQSFQIAANFPTNPSGAICSYPNVWVHDAQGTIDSYAQTTSSFSESFPRNAQTQAHAMFDLWFDNWNYEVMVQYDFSNDSPCQGSWPIVANNVSFGGSNGVPVQPWHLCKSSDGKSLIWKLGAGDGGQEQSEQTGSVDLLSMLKYLERHNYLPQGSTWTALSMGWEIASTGGQNETFTGSGFHVTMTGGNNGYWLVGSDGGIFSFGKAQFYGSTGSLALQRPVVGITPAKGNNGYWLVASDGGVFAFNAPFEKSLPQLGFHPAGSGLPNSLNQPIVGMVPSASGQGYYLVASDGGIFAFNAPFVGSCPGIAGGCSGPAVAVAPDASGKGYWLATATGHIYTFGNAPYLGSPGPQSSRITSMVRTADGGGYWIIDGLGQVFAYGDAPWLGGLPAGAASAIDPATAIFATADGGGYWISTALGKVYPYGDATADGDMSGTHLNGPIVAATGF